MVSIASHRGLEEMRECLAGLDVDSGSGQTWPDSSSWEVDLGLLLGHKFNLSQMPMTANQLTAADCGDGVSICVLGSGEGEARRWAVGAAACSCRARFIRRQISISNGDVANVSQAKEGAALRARLMSHLRAMS